MDEYILNGRKEIESLLHDPLFKKEILQRYLSPQQWEVFSLRYGLEEKEPVIHLSHIAKILGVAPQQIGIIERAYIKKIYTFRKRGIDKEKMITEEYLHAHPEEIDQYITQIFQEYAQERDMTKLLTQLRIISRVKGVPSTIKNPPSFESMSIFMKSLGYKLIPQAL